MTAETTRAQGLPDPGTVVQAGVDILFGKPELENQSHGNDPNLITYAVSARSFVYPQRAVRRTGIKPQRLQGQQTKTVPAPDGQGLLVCLRHPAIDLPNHEMWFCFGEEIFWDECP